MPCDCEPSHHVRGVLLVRVLDGQDPDLLGHQPGRQGARVVLDQDRHEALHGPEERPVDHDGPVPGVVGAHVLEPEADRQLEVELDRRHLPRPADGVACLHGDLGPVEGAAALVHDELEALGLAQGAQRLGRLLPLLLAADGLAGGPGRELEVEVVETEVPQEVEDEVEEGGQLAGHLLARAEDVRVVLGHPRTRVSPRTTPDFS